MKKKFILLSLMLAAVFTASATVVKTIGTGGAPTYDYGSLYEASLDLKNHPLTEDCIWKICTNLEDSVNSGIVNKTEHTLTITVDAAADREITWTTGSDNAGPSGNFVIGGIPVAGLKRTSYQVNIGWEADTAKNIIIDGSFEDDGIQHLKFKGGTNAGVVILCYGPVSNTIIKNCYIENVRTSNTNYAIVFRTENGTDRHPDGVVVEGCYLKASTTNSQTVLFRSDQKATSAGLVSNTILRNCEIVSKLRGVFFNGAMNATFEGCTFRMPSASAGYLAHGIMGNIQSGVINVRGCKFLELKTNNASDKDSKGNIGQYGLHGITASGGATVWNIENNIFTGLDALASGATTKHIELCAVRCGDPCVVRHNTFVMPSLSNSPATDLVESRVVGLLWVAGSNYVVENNIFVSHETTANNSLIRGALNANCKHNVFHHDGGNAAAVGGAVISTDSAAIVTADPTSKWKSVSFDSNMMLSGASITDNDLAVAQVAGITTDILGNTRNNPTYAGAEDPDQLTGFTHHLYEIGDNESWNIENSPEMTMVEPNVFEGTFNFTANTSYFAFTTVQSNDWDVIHAHRYGAAGTLVTDGSEQELVYNGDNSLTIAPGTYKFRVDLNQNPAKVYVEGYLYEIGNNIDWNLENHVAMTKVAANIYEKELTLTKDTTYLAFTRCASTTDWGAVNAARYATGVYQERLDDGSDETLVKGDGDATVTLFPGVYTIRVNFNTNKVTVTQSVAKVSFDSEIGYATYYNGTKGYTMPANVTGYTFNYPGGLTERFTAGQDVPAGVALVLGGPAGTFDLALKSNVEPILGLQNQLRGSDVDELTTAPGEGVYLFYGLSLAKPEPGLLPDPESVGFYWMAENGAAFTNHAHKAYLALLESIMTPEFLAPAILFNNNGATDIKKVEGQDEVVKFIQDGKLFIQKNGVTYDALGRVVR